MRAVVQRGYGAPADVLSLEEVSPPPVVGDHDVLVRMVASSVNTPDWALVTGVPYVLRLRFGLASPSTPIRGTDVAGIVEAVGTRVTDFRPGDDVFGATDDAAGGAFAEFAVVPAARLVRMPAGLPFPEAAASVMSGLTALAAVRDAGALEPGQRLLVNGASGGVGTFAVQLGKALGAHVTAVCSGRNASLVRSLGADAVIDYTRDDFTAGDERWDVILDNVMNHAPLRTVRVLSSGGRMIPNSLGSGGGIFAGLLRMATAGMLGQRWGFRFADGCPTPQRLSELRHFLEVGRLRPVLDGVHALEETADAVERMLSHRARGNVAIRMA